MRRALLTVLALALLFTAACGGEPAAPEAVVEVAPSPTATIAPTDTPEPTAAPQPTDTPQPTPTPRPTEAVCDLERLGEAAVNGAALASYRQEAVAYGQFAGEQVRQRMMTIESAVETTGGQIDAIDMRLVSYTDAGTAFHIIMVDDQIYFSQEEGAWEIATEVMSEALATQISQARAIDDALLAILADQPCQPFSETIDGRAAEGLRFTDFTASDLAALPSAAGDLSQLPADLEQSGEYLFWLVEVDEVDGLLLPVRTQLTLTFDVGDGDSVIEAVTEMSDFNAPLNIVAPEDATVLAFAVELPRPDDAVVFLEDEAMLGFFTAQPPEEVKAFYIDALAADGWTPGENRKETIDNVNADVLPFSRGDEVLEMAIAVTPEGDTLVAFSILTEE